MDVDIVTDVCLLCCGCFFDCSELNELVIGLVGDIEFRFLVWMSFLYVVDGFILFDDFFERYCFVLWY